MWIRLDIGNVARGLAAAAVLAWGRASLGATVDDGADSPALANMPAVPQMSEERFIPADEVVRAAVVEIRSEAMVNGAEVKLKQIARWSDADSDAMAAAADLVVARFGRGHTNLSVNLEELKTTLEAAGINLARVQFHGPMLCKVTRSDPRLESVVEKAVAGATRIPSTLPSITPASPQQAPATQPADGARPRTLRDILSAEVAERFGLRREDLQISFSPQDEKLANLAEPLFSFEVQARRERNIGDLSWDLTIVSAGGRQNATIRGNVRAWQTQVIVAKAVPFKQVFHDEDLVERRVLAERLSGEPAITKSQAVGQQAARDMSPSTILNSRLIQPVELVRRGELITVTVEHGPVQIKWVAEARENGSAGQTIRVRKPGDRQEFQAVLTGPQQAKLIAGPPALTKVAAVP